MPKVQTGKEIQAERARPGRSNIRPQLRALIKSSRFNDLTFQRFNVVFASQAQSNPVKPNQATPPPPGKETGKEMVKSLANFDHLDGARPTITRSPHPITHHATRNT